MGADATTGRATGAPERYAVYYPRIHFRDVEWLKATLLAFGRVYRIVPTDHLLPDDPQEVRDISERHGASKPLVIEVDPEWSGIELAQENLDRALQGVDPTELERRFGRRATADREAEVGKYAVHRSKVNEFLFQHLHGRGLVWPMDENDPANPYLRVHPDLGDAILSVSAIATARSKGADVVTDEPTLHTAVAAIDEDAVLHTLIRPNPHPVELQESRTAAQLAHVVLSTRFDTSQLTLADVAGLVRDGNDLRRFRDHLLAFAQRVPPEVPQQERDRRLEALADEVVKDWKTFEKGLPSKLRGVFAGGAADATTDLAKDAARGLVSSAFGAGALGAGVVAALHAATLPAVLGAVVPAAVPIALSVVATAFTWRRRQQESSPYRYLSRIAKAGAVELSIASSYRPAAAGT